MEESMEQKVTIKTTISCGFSEREIQDFYDLKEKFKDRLGEAKARYRNDPKDYDSLVDVNFYRLAIRRLNDLLFKIKHGKPYVIEFRDKNETAECAERKETR